MKTQLVPFAGLRTHATRGSREQHATSQDRKPMAQVLGALQSAERKRAEGLALPIQARRDEPLPMRGYRARQSPCALLGCGCLLYTSFSASPTQQPRPPQRRFLGLPGWASTAARYPLGLRAGVLLSCRSCAPIGCCGKVSTSPDVRVCGSTETPTLRSRLCRWQGGRSVPSPARPLASTAEPLSSSYALRWPCCGLNCRRVCLPVGDLYTG